MAKKFMGFKPETMTNKILPALGYSGPSDQKSINAFLAASPAAAAKMGKYTMAARQMVEGKPVNMNVGGTSLRPKIRPTKAQQRKSALDRHNQIIASHNRIGKDLFGRPQSDRKAFFLCAYIV